MLSRDSLLGSIIYQLCRLSPALASILVGYVHLPTDPTTGTATLVRIVAFLGIILVWSMTEGVLVLWLRAREAGKREQTGYMLVGVMLVTMLMPLLYSYRSRISQEAFLLLILTLSMRAASRSGWEQNRALVGYVGTFFAAFLTAASSFFATLMHINTDALLIALAFGAGVTTVDATWNADCLRAISSKRWFIGSFKVFTLLAPVLISYIVFDGGLPLVYAAILVALIPASRILATIGNSTPIESHHFTPIAGTYLLLLGILTACRVYVMGVFS